MEGVSAWTGVKEAPFNGQTNGSRRAAWTYFRPRSPVVGQVTAWERGGAEAPPLLVPLAVPCYGLRGPGPSPPGAGGRFGTGLRSSGVVGRRCSGPPQVCITVGESTHRLIVLSALTLKPPS